MESDAIVSHTPHSACEWYTVLTSQAMRGKVTVDGKMVLTTVMLDWHCPTVSRSTTTVLLLRTISRTATAIAVIVLPFVPIEV